MTALEASLLPDKADEAGEFVDDRAAYDDTESKCEHGSSASVSLTVYSKASGGVKNNLTSAARRRFKPSSTFP